MSAVVINPQFTINAFRTCIIISDVVTKVPVITISTFPNITIQHSGVPSDDEMVGEVLVNHLYYRMFFHDRVKSALEHITYPRED